MLPHSGIDWYNKAEATGLSAKAQAADAKKRLLPTPA
jgi:hypothetical protein